MNPTLPEIHTGTPLHDDENRGGLVVTVTKSHADCVHGSGNHVSDGRRLSALSRWFRYLLAILPLMFGPVLTYAADESPSWWFVRETLPWLSQAGAACASVPEGTASTDCLLDQALSGVVMEEVSRLASEQGRFLFGDNLRIANRLRWSPAGTGLNGDIDTVFPHIYRKTGTNSATINFNYDDGDRSRLELTFNSVASGTATYTWWNGSRGTTGWRLADIPTSNTPDLVVGSPSVSDASPDAGASFTLSATVRNQGSGRSGATTLRYYRSSNATITTSDTAVGTDAVGSLAALAAGDASISLAAPSSAGTYYYGACVDTVSGESYTANNCSSAVRVAVSAGVSVPRHPSVTTRISPSRPTVGQQVQYILDWNAVPGATSYRVSVTEWRPILYTRHPGGSCSVYSSSVTTRETRYTHEFTASFSNQLYYLVLACNSAGCSCPSE
ncbi:MAG: hypothetical protein OXE53_09085 [Deltaproteobacteria bacterium]|nr:hypothetical protein [Deltaproteobacteria bacterium]